MKKKWGIGLLVLIWLGSVVFVEGRRLLKKIRGGEVGGGRRVINIVSKDAKVLVQTDDIFWWMRFNMTNYPLIASRISMGETIPLGFDTVIRVDKEVEVVK
jgi:hypothetical protein